MAILRQNLFLARQLMGLRFRLSDKTVRKFAELLNIHILPASNKYVAQGT